MRGFGHGLLHAHGLLHQFVSRFLVPFRLRDVGQARVDIDKETIRLARLEQLGRELVELLGPAAVAEIFEDPGKDGLTRV